MGENLAKVGLELGSKALKSSFGKITNKGTDNIPSIFKYGVSKVKTKNLKTAICSNIPNMVLDKAKSKINKKNDLWKKIWVVSVILK